MFNDRELQVIVLGLDALRVDLVKLYSASREVGMSIERVKNEIEEVEVLSDKVRDVFRKKASSVWNVAQDLCLNPNLK